MAKTILIADPAESAAPIASICAEMGYAVEVTGATDADALAKAALACRADGLYTSNPDTWPAVLEATRVLGLPPRTSHLSGKALGAAWARQGDSAKTIFAKTQAETEAAVTALGTPCWLRSFNRLGTPRCLRLDHLDDLPLLFQKANKEPSHGVMVQQILDGPVWRVLGFKRGTDFHPHLVLREWHGDEPFRVPEALGIPIGHPLETHAPMLALAQRTADALPPTHGPLEIEITCLDAGPFLTDLRAPPDFECAVTHAHAFGRHSALRKDVLRAALGDCPAPMQSASRACVLRRLASKTGVIESISGQEQAANLDQVLYVKVSARPGDVVQHSADVEARDKLGYVVAAGKTLEDAFRAAEIAASQIRIITRPAL